MAVCDIYKGEEIDGYVLQQTAKCYPFIFHSSIREWSGVAVGKMYGVIAFLMLQGIF